MLLSLVVCYVVLIMPIINALQELPDDAFKPGMGLVLMFLMLVSGVVSLVAAAILTFIIWLKYLWWR